MHFHMGLFKFVTGLSKTTDWSPKGSCNTKEREKLIVCGFDHALYRQSYPKIVWKHKDKFSGLLLRLGTAGSNGFELSRCRIFRKYFYVEAGVVATGSIAGAMEGGKISQPMLQKPLCVFLVKLR